MCTSHFIMAYVRHKFESGFIKINVFYCFIKNFLKYVLCLWWRNIWLLVQYGASASIFPKARTALSTTAFTPSCKRPQSKKEITFQHYYENSLNFMYSLEIPGVPQITMWSGTHYNPPRGPSSTCYEWLHETIFFLTAPNIWEKSYCLPQVLLTISSTNF